MKVLLDTNIILDVVLDREPYVAVAKQLFAGIENGLLTGYLCATTVTTIDYLATKVVGAPQAQREIQKLLKLFEIAPVNRAVLEAALATGFADDAVLYESGRQLGVEAIITRNAKDFKQAILPIYSPLEIGQALQI